MVPRPLGDRWRLARARGGTLFLDSALVAYGIWCLSYLGIGSAGEQSLLSRFPWLLIAAPFVALLWQSLAPTLGQAAHNLRWLAHPGGQTASPAQHGRGLVGAAFLLVLMLLPLVAAPQSGLAWTGVVLLVAYTILSLLDPQGRSPIEKLCALRATTRRVDEAEIEVRPWWTRSRPWIVLALLILTLLVGAQITRFSLATLFDGESLQRAGNMWGEIVSPDWSITAAVIGKMVETIFMALMASILAIPIAFGLSIFGARNLMTGTAFGRGVYAIVRVLMNLTRSIEPVLWAITFSLWVGVGPFAGMLALFVHSVAALGKLYSEAIEEIDTGPIEAIQTTGATWLQMVRYAVVPQVIPPFLSFTVYRWDINVRMATILGFVNGGGIGDMIVTYFQLSAWPQVGTIIVFITLVVWMMDTASSKARARLK